MAKGKKRATVVIACVVVAAVAGVGVYRFMQGRNVAEEVMDNRALVQTQSPELGSIAVRSEFIGTIDPSQQVTVYPKASGEVLEVHFSVGDTVQPGDILCEIDSKALRTSIAQTQASLASAQAKAQLNLEMAEKSLNNTEEYIEDGYDSALITAEKAVETAEANVRTQQRNVDNVRRDIRDLRDDKMQVPDSTNYDEYIEAKQRELQQYEGALESAQIGLTQAQESLRSAQRQKTDQVDSTQDSVEMARLNADFSDQQIALQKLQDDLDNYSVKASIGGVIEQRNIDPYDMASVQSPVFVISNKDALTISFHVSEASLEHMKLGDAVTIDKSGQTAEGVITEVSTMVDSKTGLFAVKATVENASFAAHSGSTVKVYADTRKAQDDILLPIDALYYQGGKAYVFVAEDGLAKRVYVETGISDENMVQIKSGLALTDKVISTWNPNLADGAEIVLADDMTNGESDSASPNAGEAQA